MKKIAIFASGRGSNFKAIYERIISGDIPAEISIVVSNNPSCGAINFAKKNALLTLIVNQTQYSTPYALNVILKQNLLRADVDLICLAGYMKMIPKNIVGHFKNCILNIHPSLLPNFGGKGFYGMKVHESVIQSNVVESGATVHFVDNKYDHGPIIAQKKIMILNTDNAEILAEKVLKVEHKLYPEVIKAFCENRINWESGLPKIVEYNQ